MYFVQFNLVTFSIFGDIIIREENVSVVIKRGKRYIYLNQRIRLLALAIRKSQSYNVHTELVRTPALFHKIIAKVKYEKQVSYREKPQVSKSGYSHLLKPYIKFQVSE